MRSQIRDSGARVHADVEVSVFGGRLFAIIPRRCVFWFASARAARGFAAPPSVLPSALGFAFYLFVLELFFLCFFYFVMRFFGFVVSRFAKDVRSEFARATRAASGRWAKSST